MFLYSQIRASITLSILDHFYHPKKKLYSLVLTLHFSLDLPASDNH